MVMAVPRKNGRVVWKPVEHPVLQEPPSTGAYPLSRHQADDWTNRAPNVTGAALRVIGGEPASSSSALSTGAVNAILITERTYLEAPVDRRFRYNEYLLARTADGRWFQAGPDADLDHPGLRHWQSRASTWLAQLYACSTSTGW
jgi:hypothetical protein